MHQPCRCTSFALGILLLTIAPGLSVGADLAAQGAEPKLRGLAIGLHGIAVQPHYGEGVSSSGGIGIELAFAPSRFLAVTGGGTAILNGLESGRWQTLEVGVQPRLLIGRRLLLEATAALGRRSSSDFAEYTFGAFGAGVGFFLGRSFALDFRLDRVVPLDNSAPGHRRAWFGFVLHFG